ncbi:MAG: hypothetical protein DRI95_09005 [Bacteroidetes bacterium]|nr:MAG: hypothetical protein DRI95_09005 [Bacteroidota bacterium]
MEVTGSNPVMPTGNKTNKSSNNARNTSIIAAFLIYLKRQKVVVHITMLLETNKREMNLLPLI